MKLSQFFMGAIVFSSMLCCKESPKKENDKLQAADNKLVMDSIKVVDSIKVSDNLTLIFDKKVLVFEGLSDKSLLDSLYSPTYLKITNFDKKGLTDALEKEKKAYLLPDPELDLSYIDYPQKWDENSDMELFSDFKNFKTIKYTSSGYTGGAHGYYNEIYKVFDFDKKKTMTLSDLVKDPNDPNWSKLLLASFLIHSEESQEFLLVKDILLNSNFYFDDKDITFVYNQYDITAYAAGIQYLKIPIKENAKFLNNDFLRMIK